MAMKVSVTTTTMQQKEFDEIDRIDGILPTLWTEGLLTDIDCRIILSSNKLLEKKGAIHTVIMSKTKKEAAILTEIFRKLTVAVPKENPASSNEEKNDSALQSRNPFLIKTIIQHLFEFLPLKDVKLSRLVCHEWNSTAEICLRKRSTINFRPNGLLPSTFMRISKYALPNLPFHSFKFCTVNNTSWKVSEIEDFFDKWGKNIKEVAFDYIKLTRKCNATDKVFLIPKYNVTPLFINPSNITRLTFYGRKRTKIEISLEKFVSIKTLSLSNCRVIVSVENQGTRIAPLNIEFRNVDFIQNGKIIPNFHYNDLVDFSKTLNIDLTQLSADVAILDMGKQVFNLNRFDLENVSLKNWAQAKGDVQSLRLKEVPYEEKNNLIVKRLSFNDSKIDLTALPKTLEMLSLAYGIIEIICTQPLTLPNLKCIFIDVKLSHRLTYFSNCTLQILGIENYEDSSGPFTFSVGCLPKNVKTMQIELFKIKFYDNCIFELDSLILNCGNDLLSVTECVAITTQIKAKLLVLDFYSPNMEIDTLDIVKLVQTNKQSQKILISSICDLHKKTPFGGSELSKCVDKKSNSYQFENGMGKGITRDEFSSCIP